MPASLGLGPAKSIFQGIPLHLILTSGALKTVEVRGVAFEREIGVAWRRGRYFGQAVRLLLEAVFAAYGGRDEWMAKSAAK